MLSEQVTAELLATIGSGFGGGMARMREVCGSFSGVVIMSGFISPATDPANQDGRRANYALVQQFAEEFKKRNGGSIVCRELLGLSPAKKWRTLLLLRVPKNITRSVLARRLSVMRL